MAGRGRGLSLGRSRSSNHHVCVFVYKHDLSYTSGARIRRRRSLSFEKRPGDESHHKDKGRATPLHTSTPSPRARRRDRPAPRVHALFERRPRRPHVIPQSEPTTSSHSKSNTRREGFAQARTTNQGPGPAPPRRPLHSIQVERPAKESRATKARSTRRVPTATRSVRPHKHERRAR